MKFLTFCLLTALATHNAHADDSAAKDSFAKTLASGQKTWSLKNVLVKYKKSVNRAPKENWTAGCSISSPVTLKGAYPSVTANLGRFDCGTSHPAPELTTLYLLTNQMQYEAAYIPALPTEPNQFRLDLASAIGNGFIHWNSQKSLNALTKDRVVYLDFVGEERGGLGWPDISYHYVQVTFQQSDDGKSEALRIEYTLDAEAVHASTDIEITADLIRSN